MGAILVAGVEKATAMGSLTCPGGSLSTGMGKSTLPTGATTGSKNSTREGKHLATWGTSGQNEGQFNRPSGVAIDSDGDIYVSDWGNERVQVLDPDGRFITELKGEATLSKWADDYFVSNPLEYKNRLVADLEPDPDRIPDNRFRPKSALIEKIFWGPTSVKTDDQDRIYIADSGRHRIQIYQKHG